ncbi:hypothetical protein U728_1707 [Clostridium botulinum 202F]|uniref:hypothetical protein n=1 Tax=unclassified Clostridium TaxID=2614128 RepID=UPI000540CB24|nr:MULTISPECIES: hypothetical protein [unclassified Clostridium]AIY80812.1 hypothetical protein U728_1707 [Clostridium botulinum 202F]KAI3347947.1 hypothetical protein CIT17_06745 [Clostridium botulinum]MBY6986455.1 hypothetical protein [Clostridium botulinum]MBY7009099.1 hypothetical protein [Clostridium botulinum]
MGNILAINTIADDREKAKEITDRVIQKGDKEGRKFGDILQEELKNIERNEKSD